MAPGRTAWAGGGGLTFLRPLGHGTTGTLESWGAGGMGEGVMGLLQRPQDERPAGRNQGCSAPRAKQARSVAALALGAEAGVDPAAAIEISAYDKAGARRRSGSRQAVGLS